ncbi:MAG TPA: PhoH family protein [Allosphingosinicella sp.]|jgi:phosphate starvation-inducible PhoH-like protein
MNKKTPNTEKRTLKTEPKLLVSLNDEQKEFVELFYQYDVNFLLGDFGSGKSLAAVHTALKAFRKKQCDNIWITRPMLKNSLAALPGTLEEKMAPYTYPIIQNLEVCQGKEQTDKMLKEGLIKVMPIEVAKGVTFMKSVVIVDEFQDMDYNDFRTILTRLGENSKMIFCGSLQQIDKAIAKKSCIYNILKLEESNLVGFTTLKANHRNAVLTDIINYLENE